MSKEKEFTAKKFLESKNIKEPTYEGVRLVDDKMGAYRIIDLLEEYHQSKLSESKGTDFIKAEDIFQRNGTFLDAEILAGEINQRHTERCKEVAVRFAEYWAAEEGHPESVYLSASDAWDDWNNETHEK